jgi:hypothetical protein
MKGQRQDFVPEPVPCLKGMLSQLKGTNGVIVGSLMDLHVF